MKSPLLPGIALLTSLLACPAVAVTPVDRKQPRQTITLDYLMESCTVIGETAGGMVPHFDCETYLYGVLDSQRAMQSGRPAAQRSCVPASLAPWQVWQDIERWIPREEWSKPAAPLLVEALGRRFPCR